MKVYLTHLYWLYFYYVMFAFEFLGIKDPLRSVHHKEGFRPFSTIFNLTKSQKKDLVKARWFAFRKHRSVRQKYADKPYFYHIDMVSYYTAKFYIKTLLPDRTDHYDSDTFIKVYKAALFHDLIEDARMTYHDIKKLYGSEVAELVYACTDMRGKTRDERHSKEFYEYLSKSKYAMYVKLCDVYSNSLQSKRTGHSMHQKYKKDFPNVVEALSKSDYFKDVTALISEIQELYL